MIYLKLTLGVLIHYAGCSRGGFQIRPLILSLVKGIIASISKDARDEFEIRPYRFQRYNKNKLNLAWAQDERTLR